MILQLINLEDAQIFSEATVNTALLLFLKGDREDKKALIVNKIYQPQIPFNSFVEENKFFYGQKDFDFPSWSLVPKSTATSPTAGQKKRFPDKYVIYRQEESVNS